MTTNLKHVGKLKNTGDRVVVIFRELLDENGKSIDADNALVIYPDRLQDRYHDRMMDLLESDRAQETENFFEVLNARTFHDGNNMLSFLHHKGFLKKVLVDNIVLCPSNHERIPLREYNERLSQNDPKTARKLDEYVNEAERRNDTASQSNDVPQQHVRSEDIVEQAETAKPSSEATSEEQAKSLLAQAHIMKQEREMLDQEISRKEQQAYKLDPSLNSENTNEG